MRRKVFMILSTFVALVFLGAASYAQDAGAILIQPDNTSAPVQLYRKSYALIIGIDNYTNGCPRLSSAVSDAENVARTLGAQGFDVRLEKNLVGEDLERVFKEWFLLAGQDDDARLLVWFAGHGH